MRGERPGREAGRVVGVEAVESRRDRVNKGGTVKFEKACPVLETEEEDGHRFDGVGGRRGSIWSGHQRLRVEVSSPEMVQFGIRKSVLADGQPS